MLSADEDGERGVVFLELSVLDLKYSGRREGEGDVAMYLVLTTVEFGEAAFCGAA